SILNQWPLGVGANGFQDAFAQVGPALCPEEPASAHHLFADWLASFGWMGLGWIASSAMLLWRASCVPNDHGIDPIPEPDRGVRESAFIAAGWAGVIALIASASTNDPVSLAVIVAALAAMVLTARTLAPIIWMTADHAVGWRVGAILALIVTASLDMLFWHSGSTLWSWAMLGCAAAWGGSNAAINPWIGRLGGVIAGALALSIVLLIPPLFAQESMIEAAAHTIIDASDPMDSKVDLQSMPDVRVRAGQQLIDAFQVLPTRHRVRVDAAQQFLQAMHGGQREGFDSDTLMRAHQLMLDAHSDPNQSAREARLLAETTSMMAARQGASIESSVVAWRELVLRTPNEVSAWIRLGDALGRAGQPREAASAWTQALRLDELRSLDPLRRLPQRERKRVQSAIDGAMSDSKNRP
ncbi:MAG: tetratricopeptide repeat protein, partial [Planctomycetota bacterium]|nr:tetratricopeptide repeat protein [Planctomycetota bacterium]